MRTGTGTGTAHSMNIIIFTAAITCIANRRISGNYSDRSSSLILRYSRRVGDLDWGYLVSASFHQSLNTLIADVLLQSPSPSSTCTGGPSPLLLQGRVRAAHSQSCCPSGPVTDLGVRGQARWHLGCLLVRRSGPPCTPTCHHYLLEISTLLKVVGLRSVGQVM